MSNLALFGIVNYDGKPTVDIFHNTYQFYKNIEPSFILKEYSITGSPRPELLSYLIYGSVHYYWVLLVVNEIYDPYYDWIMPENAIHEYSEQKYQYVGGSNSVAYHINSQNEKFWDVVSYPDEPNVWYDKHDLIRKYPQYNGSMIPVTNLEHEINENEKRRVIKIVQPGDIDKFVSAYRQEMEAVL